MFFDLIRPVLCNHVDEWFIDPRRVIHCRQCSLSIDVTTLLSNSKDPIACIQLAYEYARLTGDVNIRCHFTVKIDRVLPNTITTKLSVIYKSIELLKALNYPFIQSDVSSTPPNRKLFQNLMNDYLDLFDRNSPSSSSTPDKESLAIRAIVTQIKNAFDQVDYFEQYFNVLVPYVQSLAIQPLPFSSLGDNSAPTRTSTTTPAPIPILGDILYRELERTQYIRNTYSKYCVAFDITYITALCFLCGDDTDVLYNLTLDLSARLCTGYFVLAPVPLSNWTLAQTIQTFISKHVTPTQNIQLYYHLQKFKRDEVEECFSEEFLKQFSDLGEAVRNHIGLDEEDHSKRLLKYAYQQTYPYILFDGKDWEYYGFVMALSHYIGATGGGGGTSSSCHQHPRKLSKGVLANCRKIYRFVKQSILKIQAFENSSSKNESFFWTRDVLNVFLCSDSKFETELVNMLNTIVATTEDFNNSTTTTS